MYQDSVITNGVCTFTFDNGYSYPPPWTQGTKRQSPPPPLVMAVKQEHPPQQIDQTQTMVSPTHHQYYQQQQHYQHYHQSVANGYYGLKEEMCQPLVMDDYSSNMSSPDLATGLSLYSPTPTDVLSSSTSSPSFDDHWSDLCSPTFSLQHPTSPYGMDQRRSFDDAMFLDNNTEDGMGYSYSCNKSTLVGHYRMDSTSTISSPLPSPSLSYQPTTHTMARHQSVPTLYHLLPPSPPPTSDNRPYQCHLCSRSFARKHDLQRHIRVHTGDKPYACLCCKKAFARTDALKRHLRMEEVCRTSPQIQAMKVIGKRRYKNL